METIIRATPQQKKLIHINAPTRDIKEEFVQWAMDDNSKISCNDLTFDAANMILVKLGKEPHKLAFRAVFDKDNERHKYILSLCMQYGWSTTKRRITIADLDKLNTWMHSQRCPVQKKLKDMNNDELTKFIGALEGMVKSKFK
jgi:hypothetical protein